MSRRVTTIVSAGIWAVLLSAQTPPPKPFPGVPQFIRPLPDPAKSPAAQAALRQFLANYTSLANQTNKARPGVCAIRLLEVPVSKNVERMPTVAPRPEGVGDWPSVLVPAPPCPEAKR
jgi:hypothetical protein